MALTHERTHARTHSHTNGHQTTKTSHRGSISPAPVSPLKLSTREDRARRKAYRNYYRSVGIYRVIDRVEVHKGSQVRPCARQALRPTGFQTARGWDYVGEWRQSGVLAKFL